MTESITGFAHLDKIADEIGREASTSDADYAFQREAARMIYDLRNALEAAESRATKLKADIDAGAKDYSALMDRHDAQFVRAEKAEAQVARLTAERDWLAQKMADVEATDEDGRFVLTCPNSKLRAVGHDCDKIACWQCWKEAARKAVEGEA